MPTSNKFEYSKSQQDIMDKCVKKLLESSHHFMYRPIKDKHKIVV